MSLPRKSPPPEIPADPFNERRLGVSRLRVRMLGGEFEFECGSAELRRLVEWAYKDLPRHKLSADVPRLRVSLSLAPVERVQRGARTRAAPLRSRSESLPSRAEPPRLAPLSGAGLLGATTGSSDFAVVSADYRSALVVVSREMLRFPYQTRYELIEFAVFTLAARAQGLMPLHAACVGQGRQGILLIGDSGAGKSTAALHCLLRGLDFVSEDSVLVAPDSLLATGVANFLHIRRDSLHSVPRASAAVIRQSRIIRRRSGVEKFEIDLRRPGFRLAAHPLRVAGVVFVRAEHAHAGSLLTPLRRREAVARFQASQPYAVSQAGWATFKQHLAAAPAFELRRGRSPAEAAEALQGLLADGRLERSR